MLFLYYLAFISLVSAVVFCLDKYKAKHAKWRIPESSLHMLEGLGGVFVILVLMYNIRHKNAKSSYYIKTYLILFAWGVGLGYWGWKHLS